MLFRKSIIFLSTTTLALGLMLLSWNSMAHNHDHKGHKHKGHKHKGHSHKGHSHKGHKHKGHSHNHKSHSHSFMNAYDAVRIAFAADSLSKAKQASKQVLAQASKFSKGTLGKKIIAAAKKIRKSKGIEAARLAFGQLSKAVIAHIKSHPKHAHGVQVFSCPMAKGYKKWLQVRGKMANPYMGKKMLMCGSRSKL